jgi:adenine deaminase
MFLGYLQALKKELENMQIEKIKRVMAVAEGKEEADLLIKNSRLVNVTTGQIDEVDIAVAEGKIAGVYFSNYSKKTKAAKILDVDGSYVTPGFIGAHEHIGATLMSAVPFAEALLTSGTTGMVSDLHDVLYPLGLEGLRWLIEEIKLTPLKTYLMVPPCVPSSPNLEDAGVEMTLQTMQESMKLPFVLGIAEVMDFKRVLEREPELLKILAWAQEQGIFMDGHCPELVGDSLQAYAAAGPIRTDHESVTVEEMLEKYRLGMKVIIRRGSLKEPASAAEFISKVRDTSNILLCVDGGITVGDIVDKGYMNYALRSVVEEGVDPIIAVQMATINVARTYGLDGKIGVIAPGRCADIVVMNNLRDFDVQTVLVDGQQIPPLGEFKLPRFQYPDDALNTIQLPHITNEMFKIKSEILNGSAKVNVINVVDGTFATTHEVHEMKIANGELIPDTERDLLKAAVLERYGKNGSYGLGVVKGFGLRKGAFGGSNGHDPFNVVIVGDNDEDMALAANTIKEEQGGIVVVSGGEVLSFVKLPIGGVMSDRYPDELKDDVVKLEACLANLGCKLTNPILSLSMQISLAVIPEIRLTNRGLVHVASAQFIPLFVE